jgi:hypothetical protein
MRSIIRSAPLLVVLGAIVGGCAESAQTPVTPKAAPAAPRHDYGANDVWNMADVEADFGGVFSLDTTQAGTSASPNVSYDVETGDGTFCRDHFNALDLWWDGGHGLMSFHMDPPILFRSYRPGTYKSPRNLIFRRAVYETLDYSEATDPAGNLWRFHGRFNALCRGGEFEIGPIVFGGQIIVAQDPIDRPVLVRTACNGGATPFASFTDYDPYDSGSSDGSCSDDGTTTEGSGIQYEPGNNTGGETVDWNTGIGNGGSSACGPFAVVEYICIDVWNGSEWSEWSCGYATTC